MSIFNNSIVTIFSPNDSIYIIKKNPQIVEGILIYFLVCISRVFQIYFTHIPLNLTPPNKANFIIELLKIILPIFLWILSSYAVTLINDGESKLSQIFIFSAYAMLPFIFMTIFITAISDLISLNEMSVYNFLIIFMWVWVGILFFIQVRDLNNYGFLNTIKAILLSIFGMALLAAILALLYILTVNVIEFFKAVYFELNIILLK